MVITEIKALVSNYETLTSSQAIKAMELVKDSEGIENLPQEDKENYIYQFGELLIQLENDNGNRIGFDKDPKIVGERFYGYFHIYSKNIPKLIEIATTI